MPTKAPKRTATSAVQLLALMVFEVIRILYMGEKLFALRSACAV